MTSPAKILASLVLCTAVGTSAYAIELRGLLDVRAVAADAERGWTREGMGKLRYDKRSDGLGLGQAFLRADGELLDAVGASIVLSAADDRSGVVDVNEAWFGWNPLPRGPWKTRVKAGAFFPATSLEIDYDSVGWTPTRTISSSAINSWIGEELRTKGIELTLSRSGRFEGSPHDYGFTLALFSGNDPAGTLIAWRGWSVSDRITGLSESLQLADLPVYRPTGRIWRQSRTIHVFRELDGRLGYYAGAHYSYGDRLEAAVLHYDNRANPTVVEGGQYGWTTRFNHGSLRLRPGGDWELAFQVMKGSTLMGPIAVRLDYDAWYLLVSRPVGAGTVAVRYDRFRAREDDILPSDPNGEDGNAWAFAYSYNLSESLSFVAEALVVRSDRPARTLIGENPRQTERSLMTALRWRF